MGKGKPSNYDRALVLAQTIQDTAKLIVKCIDEIDPYGAYDLNEDVIKMSADLKEVCEKML